FGEFQPDALVVAVAAQVDRGVVRCDHLHTEHPGEELKALRRPRREQLHVADVGDGHALKGSRRRWRSKNRSMSWKLMPGPGPERSLPLALLRISTAGPGLRSRNLPLKKPWSAPSTRQSVDSTPAATSASCRITLWPGGT